MDEASYLHELHMQWVEQLTPLSHAVAVSCADLLIFCEGCVFGGESRRV